LGDLFPGLSDHTIRVLAMLGSWLAGIGSLAAVVVSLWLALRSERLRLKVRVVWQTEQLGLSGPPELRSTNYYILFSVTNTSLRTVIVQSVEWLHKTRLGRVTARLGLSPMDPRLPQKLEPGGICEIRFRWSTSLKSIVTSPKFGGAIINTPIGCKAVRVGSDIRKSFSGSTPTTQF